MNRKMIMYTIGEILMLEGLLMILPLIVSFIYDEGTFLSFLIPILICLVIGFVLTLFKPKNKTIYAREGFLIVGFSWICMSLIGALPFVISKEIPNYINALFETISGFTTTGSTILEDVTALSKGMLFWRSFTHWIGGMGVLVFVLAIIPTSDAKSIYILKAESAGPQVGKLVSKVKATARILYLIYIVLTIIQIAILVCGEMGWFEAVVHSFGTAGTGGFGIKADSIGSYSTYSQIVITVFMVLFGVNFNLFYLILIGNFKQFFKNSELKWYLGIFITASIVICLNVFYQYDNATPIGETLRHACFQVASIMSTTGYATVNFNLWPALSKTILVILMFIGASAGSTCGGFKVSRFVILAKSLAREIKKTIHPNAVTSIKYEGRILEENVVEGTQVYFITMIAIFAICLLLVSADPNVSAKIIEIQQSGNVDLINAVGNTTTFETNFTAVATCLNDVGPGLGLVGPAGNFNFYSYFSKIVLSFAMLIGRLEIFPIIMLFNPKTYTNK